MMTHELKCWPEFYEDIASNVKTFEIRKDDRDFRVGDIMRLREWDPKTKQYSGRVTDRHIVYKLGRRPGAGCAADLGLKEGYAILGIEPI